MHAHGEARVIGGLGNVMMKLPSLHAGMSYWGKEQQEDGGGYSKREKALCAPVLKPEW